MGTLILGIDEAGRGPVIGPMVLAGCLIKEESQIELKKLGVKDSKELTQKRREYLSEKIKEIAETFEIVLSSPSEIDNSLKDGTNLNYLEAKKIAEIINKINKGYSRIRVIVDCPSVTIGKWTDILKTNIENLSNLEIVCEHKADKNHVAVSAASILAKCIREKEMEKLKETYGTEIGSGYTSDPSTIKFLELNVGKNESSGIFRKSWDTWKKASEKIAQRRLF
jgi:ribonuclease HII